jgi:hypothetical protein
VVFQPVEAGDTAEVRCDGADAAPAGSHFFVAVCAHRPQIGNPTFVFVPRTGNVLREREQHIGLLERELTVKNEWLEKAKQELADLNQEHQKLLEMFRAQKAELEARNAWAEKLNQALEERSGRVAQLQDELASEQAAARGVVEGYESKVLELEEDIRQKTAWARDTESRLGQEIAGKSEELAKCVEILHQAEETAEDRRLWAERLQQQITRLERQLAGFEASRWMKLGRRFGLGPEQPDR